MLLVLVSALPGTGMLPCMPQLCQRENDQTTEYCALQASHWLHRSPLVLCMFIMLCLVF